MKFNHLFFLGRNTDDSNSEKDWSSTHSPPLFEEFTGHSAVNIENFQIVYWIL